jgi:hypothetical protein
VGDLADDRLDEAVLAALRRAGVLRDLEDLAPDERSQPRLQDGSVLPGDGRQGIGREGLAQDGGILEEAPVEWIERIEA